MGNTSERSVISDGVPEEATSAAPIEQQELQRAVEDLQRRVLRLEERLVGTNGPVLVSNPAADQTPKQLFTPGR